MITATKRKSKKLSLLKTRLRLRLKQGETDKIKTCLDILENLIRNGVNPDIDDYWNLVDKEYQGRTFAEDSKGKSIEQYQKRYKEICGKIKRISEINPSKNARHEGQKSSIGHGYEPPYFKVRLPSEREVIEE